MARFSDEYLLQLLQACAACAPAPLYPLQFAKEHNLDRAELDLGLDELGRRGLIKLTEWVKERGQGRQLTEAGEQALKTRQLLKAPPPLIRFDQPAEDATTEFGRGEIVRQAVFAPSPPYITYILLAANIGYFLVGAVYALDHGWSVEDYLAGTSRATTDVLIDLGALHPGLVFPGPAEPDQRPQYERIILFLFLHVGFFHLLFNMYFLGTIARQIESMWGSWRYLVIYLISGIVSGCVVLLIPMLEEERRIALTAGASGCLFGLFVAMVVWFGLNHHHLPDNLVQAWSRNIGTNVIVLVVINFLPGVSWQGHFGGAVGGLLTALLLHLQRFHPMRVVRILALLGVPLIPVGFFLALLWEAGRL